MLTAGQYLVYKKDGEKIGVLNDRNFRAHDLNGHSSAGYIRHEQPFAQAGNRLSMPLYDGGIWVTSPVKNVQVRGNTIVYKTENSTYEVTYVGIDLDKALGDGPSQGVNTSDVEGFPHETHGFSDHDTVVGLRELGFRSSGSGFSGLDRTKTESYTRDSDGRIEGEEAPDIWRPKLELTLIYPSEDPQPGVGKLATVTLNTGAYFRGGKHVDPESDRTGAFEVGKSTVFPELRLREDDVPEEDILDRIKSYMEERGWLQSDMALI